jgi:hypothetical protein
LPALESSIPKSNQPANYDYFKEWRLAVLQMPVPGEGHEDIGDGQQRDRPHGAISVLSVVGVGDASGFVSVSQ